MKEEEILKEFQDLQSEIKQEKIKLERDENVSNFVDRLFEKDGWACYFHIVSNCLERESLIYYSNFSLDKERLLSLLDRSFASGSGFFADILSKYLRNYGDGQEKISLDHFQDFVDKGALKLVNECMEYCAVCDKLRIIEANNRTEDCHACNTRLFHIMQASVPESVRNCISNGQLLELFAKKTLQKTGFTLITKAVDGTKVSTSIPYRVYGSDIEIDVGAVRNSSLLLVECKTGRLVPNDISQKMAQYKLLIDTLRKRMRGLPDLHIRFLALGEIDRNVELKTYESAFSDDLNLKSLEVVSREQLLDLIPYIQNLLNKM